MNEQEIISRLKAEKAELIDMSANDWETIRVQQENLQLLSEKLAQAELANKTLREALQGFVEVG